MSYSNRNLVSNGFARQLHRVWKGWKLRVPCHPQKKCMGTQERGNFQSEGFLHMPWVTCSKAILYSYRKQESASPMRTLAGRVVWKWNGPPGKVMSFLAWDTIVQGLDNHHLLGLSQREFKHGTEKSGKVIFKLPFSLRIFRRLGERRHCVSHSAHSQASECQPYMLPHPPSIWCSGRSDGRGIWQPLHQACYSYLSVKSA